MKKFLSLVFALLLGCTVASAESNITITPIHGIPENVVKMPYTVKMSDVTREGKYTGQLVDGLPHGYGAFETTNSQGVNWHYLGNWENGCMTGNGGQYWDDGRATVGTFANNDMIYGTVHDAPNTNYWVDYRQDEDGCIKVIEYRPKGSILFDGCVNAKTGQYHKGTVYTADGKVFFSGEIGEGFDWNLLYID